MLDCFSLTGLICSEGQGQVIRLLSISALSWLRIWVFTLIKNPTPPATNSLNGEQFSSRDGMFSFSSGCHSSKMSQKCFKHWSVFSWGFFIRTSYFNRCLLILWRKVRDHLEGCHVFCVILTLKQVPVRISPSEWRFWPHPCIRPRVRP